MCFNSYWIQMSLHSLCLLFVRSLILRILLCIPPCFHLLHDGTMNFSLGLDTVPWHHSSWTGRFCINDVTALVILFFILKCCHLLFGTSLHSSLLVGDYVCGLSYKSNAFAWLETFHKENSYWKILMHKYMIMQLL